MYLSSSMIINSLLTFARALRIFFLVFFLSHLIVMVMMMAMSLMCLGRRREMNHQASKSKRAFSSATLYRRRLWMEMERHREWKNLRPGQSRSQSQAIWNNAIIIISNQISVTEAKNTHHIKAMTRREMKDENRSLRRSILFWTNKSRVQWGGEAILRLFYFFSIILFFNFFMISLF